MSTFAVERPASSMSARNVWIAAHSPMSGEAARAEASVWLALFTRVITTGGYANVAEIIDGAGYQSPGPLDQPPDQNLSPMRVCCIYPAYMHPAAAGRA